MSKLVGVISLFSFTIINFFFTFAIILWMQLRAIEFYGKSFDA